MQPPAWIEHATREQLLTYIKHLREFADEVYKQRWKGCHPTDRKIAAGDCESCCDISCWHHKAYIQLTHAEPLEKSLPQKPQLAPSLIFKERQDAWPT